MFPIVPLQLRQRAECVLQVTHSLGTVKNGHTAARTSTDLLSSSGSLEPLQPFLATIADFHFLNVSTWKVGGRKKSGERKQKE